MTPNAIFMIDPQLVVDGVDLSDYVKSLSIEFDSDEKDATTAGSGGYKAVAYGLKNWKVTVKFLQSYEAGKVDDTLYPLIAADPFTISCQEDADAVSPTNPSYSGSVTLKNYTPFKGSIGDIMECDVTLNGYGAPTKVTA